MAGLLNCVFCNSDTDNKLIIFTEATLKKCQTVLKHRKEHNLKYKDVILPVVFLGSGYHRSCYKTFTGLMRKYYLPKDAVTRKTTSLKESSNILVNSSAASISASYISILPNALIPDHVTSGDPTIVPDIPVPLNSTQNIVKVESIDLPSEAKVSFVSNIRTDSDNIICIFCQQKTRKQRSKIYPLHSSDIENFVSKLDKKNENHQELINKIANYSILKIYYHLPCRLRFSYKSSLLKETPKSQWHEVRQHHQTAFEKICAFIDENVIKNGRWYFLTYLHRYYMELLKESEGDHSEESKGHVTSHNLEHKIKKTFNKEIKFLKVQNKKLLAPKNLLSIDDQTFKTMKDDDILHKAALLLRKSVLKIEKKILPQIITTESLEEGGVSIPQDLLNFYFTLVAGSDRKRKDNPECIRQVKSYCEDIIYGVYNGEIKTSKHTMLGMSPKVTESNPEVKELETEVSSMQTSRGCPEIIIKSVQLGTGDAFDNINRFVETNSCKDTSNESQLINLPSGYNVVTSSSQNRKQKALEAITVVKEEPSTKKIKTNNLDLLVNESENEH